MITVGDCIDFKMTKTDLVFTRITCTRKHDYEVYAVMIPDTLTAIHAGESRTHYEERTCPHATLVAYAPRFAARHPHSAEESGSWGDGTTKRICVITPDSPNRSIRTP